MCLFGFLIYLTITRPELSYYVDVNSQFMHVPTAYYWDSTICIVCFLKGSLGQGILLCANFVFHLTGYYDSDWEMCPLTRRSLSAYIIFLGGSPISWKTKKQDTVLRKPSIWLCLQPTERLYGFGLYSNTWVFLILTQSGCSMTTRKPFTLLQIMCSMNVQST